MIEIPEGYEIVRAIVRCKDCKYWGKKDVPVYDGKRICKYWRRQMEKSIPCTSETDFCSKGVKK